LSTVEMTLIGCPLLSVLANSSAIFGLLSLVPAHSDLDRLRGYLRMGRASGGRSSAMLRGLPG